MATAEEILAAMTAEETQQVLVIDNDLRTIAIPEGVTLLGVTSDDDVRRLRFAMPRMCGEFDLSAFALRINYLNAGSEGDVYPVADAETDGDTIRFSWLVGRHACKYKGDVCFIVCAKLLGDGGEIEKEYNTTLASLPVLEGLETGEAIAQAHPDVIEAILMRLDTLENSGGVSSEQIANAVAAYLQKNPVEAGATAEQAAQIEANKQAIEELKQSGVGGITEETDPTVPDWAKQPSRPTYTAGEVGADAAGTAAAQVVAHNVSGEAHADMRALIEGLTSRLNALADSDDETLDQLSEIVAYIKSNKALIDAVTTGKVSTGDIVDNLTTNSAGKVLSAAQGVRLKALIDAIVIPDKLPNPQPLTINGQSYDGSAPKSVAIPTVPSSLPNPNKLTFTGAVTAEYDGSSEVSVEIPSGGSGSYELPVACPTQLGGVMPVAKTDEMTQAVGVDEAGGLWTASGGSGEGVSDGWEPINCVTIDEDVNKIVINTDTDGNPFSYKKVMAVINVATTTANTKFWISPNDYDGGNHCNFQQVSYTPGPSDGYLTGIVTETEIIGTYGIVHRRVVDGAGSSSAQFVGNPVTDTFRWNDIHAFSVFMYGNVQFASGSKLTLYGQGRMY